MPEINEERIFGSNKTYSDVNDEPCNKCGAMPPDALKFGMKPCPDIKYVGLIPTGWCGLIHYIYVCMSCKTMFDFDEILNRKKVFFMSKKDRKILVGR